MSDGLLHTNWANIQDAHLWEKSLWTPWYNGTQWTVQIVKFLWRKFYKLWHKRNEIVHASNEQEHIKLKMDKYKCTLETMYHLKDRLQAVDRQYMFQNLQEVEEFLQT
eukprot:13723025-Ditylum_brightwellii.AAC.1